jgi:hypothetical protein
MYEVMWPSLAWHCTNLMKIYLKTVRGKQIDNCGHSVTISLSLVIKCLKYLIQ